MKHLYLFYIGGNAGKSNIEVHDIQFVICEDYQQAIPTLKKLWFGDADKIHIDGWQKINWADGYDVIISDTPPTHDERLYFVNVGGYQKGVLAELHEFGLFVATSPQQAKQKAIDSLLVGFAQQHKDNLKEIDNVLELNHLTNGHIHLRRNDSGKAEEIGFQGYMPI